MYIGLENYSSKSLRTGREHVKKKTKLWFVSNKDKLSGTKLVLASKDLLKDLTRESN